MKTMNELAGEIHEWARDKGWWSRPTDNIAAKLLLVHTELSEATEELRKAGQCPHGSPDVDYDDLRRVYYHSGEDLTEYRRDHDNCGNCKPEGFGVELADTIIRLLDIAGRLELDMDVLVEQKMAYNRKRSRRHGGKGL